MIAVSSLLIFSFMAYANALRVSSEAVQLKNLMNNVAAKCTELSTITLTTGAMTEVYIEMPTTIGDKQYWLQLRNDSAKTWLDGGLGNIPMNEADMQIYLPKEANASGYYIASYGSVCLKCHLDNGVLQIQLASSSEGD